MSTKPRLAPASAEVPADFGSLMSHAPNTMVRFFETYSEFWQRGVVAQEVKEMTRMRNARITDCGY
jgi:hypothetical protein